MLHDLIALWRLLNVDDLRGSTPAWIEQTRELVIRYRTQSARSAAVYYEELRSAEVGEQSERPPIVPVDDKVRARITASLLVTGPTEIRKRIAAGESPEAAATAALETVQGAAGRHTLDGGRETLVRAGAEDRLAVRFARITDSDPCWFCAMMASRGYVYLTRGAAGAAKNARFEGDGVAKWHDFCGCGIEASFVEDADPPENNQRLQRLWNESTKGKGGVGARLAFRRAIEGRSLPDDPINRAK